MGIGVRIFGGGKGKEVQVTPSGELVVGPLCYDLTVFHILDSDATAYNFFSPRPKQQFVITGFLAQGDQAIAPNASAVVTIFEACDTLTATVDRILIQFAIVRSQQIPALGLRTLVNAGKFINASTDDDNVYLTLMGYYIKDTGEVRT